MRRPLLLHAAGDQEDIRLIFANFGAGRLGHAVYRLGSQCAKDWVSICRPLVHRSSITDLRADFLLLACCMQEEQEPPDLFGQLVRDHRRQLPPESCELVSEGDAGPQKTKAVLHLDHEDRPHACLRVTSPTFLAYRRYLRYPRNIR